jgi:hypothetical protein
MQRGWAAPENWPTGRRVRPPVNVFPALLEVPADIENEVDGAGGVVYD